MKKIPLILILSFLVCSSPGQQRIIDSLMRLPANNDTLKLMRSNLLIEAWGEISEDSAIAKAEEYLQLSEKLNYKLNAADALQLMALHILEKNPVNALELMFRSLRVIQENGNKNLLPPAYLLKLYPSKKHLTYESYRQYITGKINIGFGIIYWANGSDKSRLYFLKALEIANSSKAADLLIESYLGLGTLAGNPDSSLAYLHKAIQISFETGHTKNLRNIYDFISKPYHTKKDYPMELYYKKAALEFNLQAENTYSSGWSYLGLAEFYKSFGELDSVIFFGKKALQTAQLVHSSAIEYWTARLFYETYKSENKRDSAFKYLEQMLAAKEKISSEEQTRQFQDVNYNYQLQQAAIEAAKKQYRNKLNMYGLIAGLAMLVLLVIIFWRNAERRKKQYQLLQKQEAKTEQALQDLKATQSQLIQSEKMASLGELTAGIAHEIQNPLNFVNNFSEVSNELIDELHEEIGKGNTEEVKTIASDIKQNLEKINHHGKRADAVVKGMLQHSRSSSGKKEPTDFNELADEYLRLAYHGMRAKDKSFNAKIETDFDNSVGKINVIPQDVGRVLVNLINNAFYALNEKKKLNIENYEPAVTVSTKKLNDKVEIRVKDNGNGIPSKIADKIFQPFFTTKPTGQGTGLGLSLSYDIVKVHGGELNVEAREGEGAEFIIRLPME